MIIIGLILLLLGLFGKHFFSIKNDFVKEIALKILLFIGSLLSIYSLEFFSIGDSYSEYIYLFLVTLLFYFVLDILGNNITKKRN